MVFYCHYIHKMTHHLKDKITCGNTEPKKHGNFTCGCVPVNVTLSLYLIQHHAMKACVVVDV
jgi:hypothetical protein